VSGWLPGVILMATFNLSPADKDADRHAWAMLQRKNSAIDWDKASMRRADLTGEGVPSRVMVGRDDEHKVFVGIVRPGREGPLNPQLVELGMPQSLSLAWHKLETPEDCIAEGDAPLEGCRPKRGKRGLTLTVDTSNVMRLYWNAPEKRFDRWPPPK
jgi:hypothetical protein